MSGYEATNSQSTGDLMADYYASLRRGELVMSRCVECESHHFPPRPVCPHCGSSGSFSWEKVSGYGTVWSMVTFHKKYLADFRDPPYLVAIVELDEGPRIVSTVTGVERDQVRVGMPVEARFNPGEALVYFTPRSAPASAQIPPANER